jgi:hypothetical protein
MLRRRQLDGEMCSTTRSVETVYNENDLVPTYPGIIFELVALADDMEVLTLEFDARIEDITDFTVEVFATDGDSLDKMSDESQWTQLANTQAAVSPAGRGLVIPQPAFTSIKLKRGQRTSIYIAMKGPWLENVAQALDKTGEVQLQNDDFALYVGVGLNERFPEDFDKTVDPQFSGVIHYRKEVDCRDALVSTTVDLQFLASQSEDPVFVSKLNRALDETLRDSLLVSNPFYDMISRYRLRQQQATQITKSLYEQGACPEEWEKCPRNVLAPRLFFEHTNQLEAGFLQYEIYRFTQALTEELRSRLGTDEVLYVGLRPLISDFSLTLHGLPSALPLTPDNSRFLEATTTDFLAEVASSRDSLVRVMDTVVQSHTFDDGRRRRRGLSSTRTLQVGGVIMGAQAGFLPTDNFSIVLHESVLAQNQDFINAFKAGAAILPQDGDSTTAYEFFGGLHGLSASFDASAVEDAVFEDASSGSRLLLYIVGLVVLCLALAGKFGWDRYHRHKASKAEIDRQAQLEECRRDKERRDEKRKQNKEMRDSIRETIPIEVTMQDAEVDDDDALSFEDPTDKEDTLRRSLHRSRSDDDTTSDLKRSIHRSNSSDELKRSVHRSRSREDVTGPLKRSVDRSRSMDDTMEQLRRSTRRSGRRSRSKEEMPGQPNQSAHRAPPMEESNGPMKRSVDRRRSVNEATDQPIRSVRRASSMDGVTGPKAPVRRRLSKKELSGGIAIRDSKGRIKGHCSSHERKLRRHDSEDSEQNEYGPKVRRSPSSDDMQTAATDTMTTDPNEDSFSSRESLSKGRSEDFQCEPDLSQRSGSFRTKRQPKPKRQRRPPRPASSDSSAVKDSSGPLKFEDARERALPLS